MRDEPMFALNPAPHRWRWLAVVFVYILIQGSLCIWAEKQAAAYPTTGLRFAQPLESSQITRALAFQTSEENTRGIFASFWGQSVQDLFAANSRNAKGVTCIGFCGNAEDCLPVTYISGGAPGAVGTGCALSDALAEKLFGSHDVIGKTVSSQWQSYTITGVFSAQETVFLYPESQNFTCAELQGVDADTPKRDAEQWVMAAGLGNPQCIIYGPQRAWIMQCLCWMPGLLAVMAALWYLGCRIRGWSALARNLLWFFLALLLALLLPYVLARLPGWLIPARWSDFSFWTELAESIRESRQAWQLSIHYWRDIARL